MGSRLQDPDCSAQEERPSSNMKEKEEEGHNDFTRKEIESSHANVEEDKNDGNEDSIGD